MSFSQVHKLLSYLLSGLGLAGLSLGGELHGLSLVLVFGAYAASALAEQPLIDRPWWIRSWNAVVIAALAVQVLRGVLGTPILSLGIEYAALLQISRLFNRRGAAEHQQIAVLALLHLIATTVLTTELSYAFVFFGFVIVTPWMLVMSHLRLEVEQAEAREVLDGRSLRAILRSRELVTPRFFAATGMLTVPIFAVTLVLFFLFPRVGLGFIPTSSAKGAGRTGFGQTVELGNFGTIRTDPTVALRFFPERLEEDPRALLPVRFRGTSFDRYNGRGWERSKTERTQIRQYGHFISLVRPGRVEDEQVRIELETLSEPVIFVPDHTVALEVKPTLRRASRVMRRLSIGAGLDIRYDDTGGGMQYVAHLSRRERAVPDFPKDEAYLEPYLEPYLALPERYGPNSKVAALARRIGGDAERADDKATRLQRWLQSPERFRYSLTLPEVSGKDPLEVFLFEKRFGHCEYFSTALAVMLRTMGVPSRNVTGFLGGEYNSYGDYYVIRQGDAHSWVEVWVGDRWIVFDPTPPAEVRQSSPWIAEFRALYDALVSRWRRHVVGYDLGHQISIFRSVAGFFRSYRPMQARQQQKDDAVRAVEFPAIDWLLVGVGAGVALLALLLGLRRRPRWPPPICLGQALDRRLKRLGKPRPASRTVLKQLEFLQKDGFSDAARLEAIVHRYLGARFGNQPLDSKELHHWLRQVGRLRAQ